MTKVTIPEDEAERLAALYRYAVLDTPPEEAFDNFAQLASKVCKAPIALISLIDAERQWFKAKVGLDISEIPRKDAFFACLVSRPDEVIAVSDALHDKRFAKNPLVTAGPRIRSCAGVPLVAPDGFVLGVLCVADPMTRAFDAEQLEALGILGRQVIAELELRRRTGELQQESLARQQAEEVLSQRIKALTTIYEVSQKISSNLDLESVCEAAHWAVGQLMPAPVFVISLLDEAAQEVEDVYLYDNGGRWPNERRPFLKGNGIGSTVIATGTPVRLGDRDEKVEKFLGIQVFGDGVDTRSLMAVPLQIQGKVIGAISVQDYPANVYGAEEERSFTTIANQIAVAISNAMLVRTVREDEERFRALAENIPEIFWLSDPNQGKILYVSPAYETIWGRSRESLYVDGRSYLDAIHPEDRPRLAAAQLEAGGSLEEQEFRIVLPDGSLHWIAARAFPICNEQGMAPRIVGIAKDITERKRAEQVAARLAAIVNSSQDAIIGKTLSGIIVNWNAGAERMYGYTAAEMINRSISVLVPPNRPDEIPQLLEQVKQGIRVESFETERLTKDGRLMPVSLTISPIIDEAGQIIGASTIAHDITDRRRLEKVRDDLMHMIVHDLRNPLSSIIMASDLLKNESLQPEQREHVEIVVNRAKTMLDLVNVILDVNRLESGQMPVVREPVALNALAAQCLEYQATLAKAKQIRLVNSVPADLPQVDIDSRLIGRVFQNLLDNAIKYSPQDAEVQISAELDRDAPSMLEVVVKDTGPGIPAELRDVLFQKEIASKRSVQGRGLGLVFCRLVVEAHGGRIWVESGNDQGTSIAFTLPLMTE